MSLLIDNWSNLDTNSQQIIGKKLVEIAHTATVYPATNSLCDFVNSIVPTNIFKALSNGDSLSVLIFFIILGIALGSIKSRAAKTALFALDGFYNALLKLVEWLMYALPFGLCFLFGGLIMSRLGFEISAPLAMLIILFVLMSLLLVIVNGFILARHTGVSFL